MPVEYNDTLDEPLVYDKQNAFLRQRSFGRANLLGETEAVELKNVSSDTSGVTRSRRGFKHILDVGGSGTVQGAGFFDGSTDYNFVIRNGTAYFYDSGNTETSVALTGASTSLTAYACQVADNIYVSTGNTSEKLKRLDASTLTETVDGNASAPTGLKFLTAQSYRVFGVVNDQLYATDILPGTDFFSLSTAAAGYIRIGEDREPATGLFAWQDNNLLFFKENQMWMINLDPVTVVNSALANGLGNATVRKVSDRLGTVSHKTIAQVGNDALFLARDGVRSVARVINDGMAATTEPLTVPIQDLIDRINWQHADTACACYRERKYILAVPLDAATTPNTLLVYDTATQGWSYWTGVNPAEFIYTNFTEPVLSYADTSGFIAELRDYIDQDSALRSDYIDHLGLSGTAASWSDDGGYVKFTPVGQPLTYGDTVLLTAFADKTSLQDIVYDVINVVGGAVTINADHASTTPASGLEFIKGEKPDWSIVSRAFSFGQDLNPKCLDWVELEFARDSDAYCDLSVILDDDDASEVESNFASGGGESISLPLTLPFTIPLAKLSRKRFGLYGGQDIAREIQFKLTESGTSTTGEKVNSRVVALRSIMAAAFVEEFEAVT